MLSKNPIDISRKLNNEEIAQALRLSIIGELDAINLYLQLANAIDNELIKKVLIDIAEEEKVHVGELLELLNRIDLEQKKALEKGAREVSEISEK